MLFHTITITEVGFKSSVSNAKFFSTFVRENETKTGVSH